jgi:hypothetical protein
MQVPGFVLGQAGSAAKPLPALRAEEYIREPAAAFLATPDG